MAGTNPLQSEVKRARLTGSYVPVRNCLKGSVAVLIDVIEKADLTGMTGRSASYYWQAYQSETASYTNNRRVGWSYDEDGRVSSTPATSSDEARTNSYDAAGRLINTVTTGTNGTATFVTSYDGDG